MQLKRVLLLCKGFPPATGGVESYSEQLARAYLARQVDVTVISQTGRRFGPTTIEYAEGRVKLYDTGSGGQFLTAIKMLRLLSSIKRTRRYDLVHATTWRPALILLVTRHVAPLIITVHGREILRVPLILRPAMHRVISRARLVITVSSETLARARTRFDGHIDTSTWVVSNNGISHAGLDERISIGGIDRVEHAKVRFLTLARLVERKNVQGCVESFRILVESGYNNFEYRIAGTGPLLESLKNQVQRSGLDDYIQFLGYVQDEEIADTYRWADVFLHPQIELERGEDFEGFGLSIADAMSFGCLAVAGAGSGPSDFIVDGETGILVDGTSQQELVCTLRTILDSPSTFRDVAYAGQKYVQKELSWKRHLDRVLSELAIDP